MQITITQTEIETAIRNHVLGLIAVRENMTIDIDLKATRGTEGFTAVIDIYPAGGPNGGKPVEQNTGSPKLDAPKEPAPKGETKAETKAAAPVAAIKEEPVVEATAEAEAPAAPAKEPVRPIFGKKSTPEKEPEVKAAEAETSDSEKPRSIFGGLTKPVNPKPDTEAA